MHIEISINLNTFYSSYLKKWKLLFLNFFFLYTVNYGFTFLVILSFWIFHGFSLIYRLVSRNSLIYITSLLILSKLLYKLCVIFYLSISNILWRKLMWVRLNSILTSKCFESNMKIAMKLIEFKNKLWPEYSSILKSMMAD